MLVSQFVDYMRYERNMSPRTIRSYSEDLDDFESFFRNLDGQLSWETIDRDIIREWVESMMDRGNSATSVNRRLSSLVSFYRLALKRGIVEVNPASLVALKHLHSSFLKFYLQSLSPHRFCQDYTVQKPYLVTYL